MEILKKIQNELKVPKNQYNKFGEYNYRSCEDILSAVKPLLGDAILTLTDDIVYIGDRYYVKATAKISDGITFEEVSAYAREVEDKKKMDLAQITGACSSYARKYALNGLFLLDDIKDADSMDNNKATKPQGQPQSQKKPGPAMMDKAQADKISELITNKVMLKNEVKEFKKWYKGYCDAGDTLTHGQASEFISNFDNLFDMFLAEKDIIKI